jgi:hypothetical protein
LADDNTRTFKGLESGESEAFESGEYAETIRVSEDQLERLPQFN